MPYALANLRTASGPVLAVETEGRYYPLSALAPDLDMDATTGLLGLLQDWATVEPRIEKALTRLSSQPSLAEPNLEDFLAPVLYPSKIMCTGTNYYDHLAKDFNVTDFDKTKYDILYFLKHSRALVGAGPSVRYPSESRQLDWEVELVAVFGKSGRRLSPTQALDHVAGYAIGLDLSARDLQFSPRHRKQFDLFGGKSFDDSSPMGPVIVPAKFVDPTDLSLKLWVNGELKQDSHTREMIWTMAEQISEVSQHMTIEAGDVLYTGSPAGIGYVSKTFLKEGDLVEAEITGLGRLSVTIAPDPDAAAARVFLK